ncbi:GNAT family N-acetyltransferase [Lutispora thermophila]|uniref:Ribosomal-protein-alanine N-acetyltransferase n=1 Tax=Lutispora thermophila DSM 19022 TaxID=1122184 RepID=A0A1M6FUW4_9FIRM|nr:GNAT family N-acetyltransferase [Lutispora thermophila]SHJ01521.1 ribosomal-protein-alanine N-acetyltransferase [Lutispora thermophila DSM 19022]
MINLKNNELETNRLYLRHFKAEDLDEYSKIMGQDEVGQWLPRGRGYTEEEVKKFLDSISKHWEEKEYGIWAVIEKNSGKIIGHCGLNYVKQNDEVEVLYGFGKEHWGLGYATEAAGAALVFGFDKIGLNRIVAFAKIENIASRRVIEKIGLKYIKDIEIFGMSCAYYESKCK